MDRTWQDIEEIAADLAGAYPEVDPLSVPLTELKRMVTTLPGFGDDPEVVTEVTLEEIQSAWYDAFEG
jgi:FeS assembly protein IscX